MRQCEEIGCTSVARLRQEIKINSHTRLALANGSGETMVIYTVGGLNKAKASL